MTERIMDFYERRARRKQLPPGLDLPRQERLRHRPRDADEDYALTQMVLAKRDLCLRAGKLVLGPDRQRTYVLGQERILEYLRQQGKH
jgi:hypothetical protein